MNVLRMVITSPVVLSVGPQCMLLMAEEFSDSEATCQQPQQQQRRHHADNSCVCCQTRLTPTYTKLYHQYQRNAIITIM